MLAIIGFLVLMLIGAFFIGAGFCFLFAMMTFQGNYEGFGVVVVMWLLGGAAIWNAISHSPFTITVGG